MILTSRQGCQSHDRVQGSLHAYKEGSARMLLLLGRKGGCPHWLSAPLRLVYKVDVPPQPGPEEPISRHNLVGLTGDNKVSYTAEMVYG